MRAGVIDEKWKWLRKLWIVFPGDCSRLSISARVRSKLMFVIPNNESPAEGYLRNRKNSQKLWDFCLFMIKVQYRDCILLLYRMDRWPYRSPTSLKTLISDITWHHDIGDTVHCHMAVSTFLNPSNLTNHGVSEGGIWSHSMRCLIYERETTQLSLFLNKQKLFLFLRRIS